MRLTQWDNLPQSAEDIRRKFTSTYVLASIGTISPEPATYYLEIDEDGHVQPLQWPQGNRLAYDYCRAGDVDVVEAVPEGRVVPYVTNGGVENILVVRRRPERQWQVGLCRANSTFYTWANGMLTPSGVDYSRAKAAFQPNYQLTTIHDSLEAFKPKDSTIQARALGPRYWLGRNGKDISLFMGRSMLGNFVYGGFFINKTCMDLKQELWDDLKIKVA